jgi:signal transduction histidine kinase
MPQGKPRFGVTLKVALGLSLIIIVGMASMLVIYRGLARVEGSLERLAAVKAPIIAAAFGMEVNINGAMLYVVNYLASRRPEYRTEAEDDVADFSGYHATYTRLVSTERERRLAEDINARHAGFVELADELMGIADRQEQLYSAIARGTEEIDYILDARLQPGLFRDVALRQDGIGAAVASANFEAETAEVGQWAANYHREPSPAARRTIIAKLGILERSLDDLFSFNLSAADRRLESALRRLVETVSSQVREVVALEDRIFEGRKRLIEMRDAMDDLLDDEIQVLAVSGLDDPREQAKNAADEVLLAVRFLVPMFLVAAGVIGFLLIQQIRRPLAMLNRGTLAVTEGDLTYRIAPQSNDEFGDLAGRYNTMVEQLQATTVSRDRLEQSESRLRQTVAELRREMDERGALEARLRRSETMSAMGALVAGVAHEVRNPLFGISSTLDALTARLGSETGYGRYIEILQEQVGRLGKLMADLLDYGRPPVHEFTSGSLNAVVDAAVESCDPLASEKGARIELRLAADAGPVRIDRGRLVLAIRNLVDNALQYAPPGSAVTVETARIAEGGGARVECAVSDFGPGFQPEDLAQVFEPFFTRRRGGTGLGLALVQRIAHEHGGEAKARNRDGGGAIVTITLPVAEA